MVNPTELSPTTKIGATTVQSMSVAPIGIHGQTFSEMSKPEIGKLVNRVQGLTIVTSRGSLESESKERSQQHKLKKEPKSAAYLFSQSGSDMLNLAEYPIECKICGRRFKKPQELGGHSSKAHPNQLFLQLLR